MRITFDVPEREANELLDLAHRRRETVAKLVQKMIIGRLRKRRHILASKRKKVSDR